MKRYLNPVFAGCILAVAIGNELVLAYLFSHDGAFSERVKWTIRAADLLFILGAFYSPRIWNLFSSRAVVAFRRAPNLAAAILGIALLFAVAVVIELGFHAYLVIHERSHPEPLLVRDVPSSELLAPGVVCREQRLDGEKVIYDYVYSLDDKGARVTPASPKEATGRDLVFFGCSFTFGTGVNDDQTLPNGVARRAAGWRVTNFGVGGYGPAHMLRQIENTPTTDIFRGNQTHVVYTFIPHQVHRTIGDMRYSSRFGRDFPYYEIGPAGRPEYRGTMTTGRPWLAQFYRVMDREAVMKFFDIDLPVRIAKRHLEFTASIVAASRDRWVEALSHADFTVVIYPEPLWAEFPAEDIVPMIEAKGIRCLNYADRFDGQPEMWIPGDYHPTAEAHDRVAQWVVEDLRLAPRTTTTD